MTLAEIQQLSDEELTRKVGDVVMNYKPREVVAELAGKKYVDIALDSNTSFAPLAAWAHTQTVINEMRDTGWCYANVTDPKTKKSFVSFTFHRESKGFKIEAHRETEQRNILECALLAALSI